MSTASMAGLLVALVAFCLCGLLISLHLWQQARRRKPAAQHQYQSLVPESKAYTPGTSTGSHRTLGASGAAIVTRPSYSQQRIQTTAANQGTAHHPFLPNRGADVISAVRPARLGSSRRAGTGLDSLIDRSSPFQCKGSYARRCTSDPERAWPQWWHAAGAEQENIVEQRL